MPFPLAMTATMTRYVLLNKLRGRDKFPLVLMLEPLHACNLTCTGCGRIREYKDTIRETIPLEQCLQAVDECGAPIVSICGGEPMIYQPLGKLVEALLERKKFVYLCTNGMFIQKRLAEFRPSSRFFFNVHIDGLEETHDLCVEREGVFKAAVDGIKVAKAANNLVMWACLIANHEALALARRFGVDVDRLREALLMSSAENYVLRHWGENTMAWADDDLEIIEAMARDAGIGLPQTALNRKLCRTLKPKRFKLDEYGR